MGWPNILAFLEEACGGAQLSALGPGRALRLALVVPFVVATLAVVSFFLTPSLAIASGAAFLGIVAAAFIKSPKKSPGRLAYLAFVRFGWISVFFTIGMTRGIVQLLYLGGIVTSRAR